MLTSLAVDDRLTMSTTPLLGLIYDKLEGLAASDTSELIPPLAKEARMVLALRKASSIVTPVSSTKGKEKDILQESRETYQTALKLLQDQILPVRAQGLALLRSLISSKSALLSTDPALLPAILDIFIFALEDDDSFLYLNAIQGLGALVDCYGKPMGKRLMQVYLGGRSDSLTLIGEGEKGRRELDKRLRIAESLNQIVQRAGEAFAVFGESSSSLYRIAADVLKFSG